MNYSTPTRKLKAVKNLIANLGNIKHNALPTSKKKLIYFRPLKLNSQSRWPLSCRQFYIPLKKILSKL